MPIDYFENIEAEARAARLEEECERNARFGASIPERYKSREHYFCYVADEFVRRHDGEKPIENGDDRGSGERA